MLFLIWRDIGCTRVSGRLCRLKGYIRPAAVREEAERKSDGGLTKTQNHDTKTEVRESVSPDKNSKKLFSWCRRLIVFFGCSSDTDPELSSILSDLFTQKIRQIEVFRLWSSGTSAVPGRRRTAFSHPKVAPAQTAQYKWQSLKCKSCSFVPFDWKMFAAHQKDEFRVSADEEMS